MSFDQTDLFTLYRVQVLRSHSRTVPGICQSYYTPLVMNQDNFTYGFVLDLGDMPTVWGFESESEAWEVCQRHKMQSEQHDHDETAVGVPDEREDFHADV